MTHNPDANYHHYITASNPYRDASDLAFQPPAWARAGEYTNNPHPSAQLIEAKGALGNGWATCCSPCTQPTIRRWTNEQKARNRRLRLWRRLQKRAPLFALSLYLEFTEAQPGYYYRAEAPRLLLLSGQHDQPTRRTPVGNDQPSLLSPFPPIRDYDDYQRLINS